MKWAAKRLGERTRSLEIRASHDSETMDFFEESGLEEALLGKASSLRCFTFEPLAISQPAGWPSKAESKYHKDPDVHEFQGWVLEQTQRIKVLQLPNNAPCLGPVATRLQHLKHLEMEAQAFVEGVTQNAGQVLLSLETLCLRQGDKIQDDVNVLGCQRLKRLAVQGKWVQAIVHDPTCQLGLCVNGLALTLFASKPLGVGGQSLGATTGSVGVHTLPSASTDIETLKVTWPLPCDGHTKPEINEKKFNFAEVEAVLGRCMSVHPQPLRNLKALSLAIQSGYRFSHLDRSCYLPRGLPNLEELVIWNAGYVVFEDPLALFSTLKSFYIYGFPLSTNLYGFPMTSDMYGYRSNDNRIDEIDMGKVLESLARRGLILDKVHQWNDRGISCMYMRAHTAKALSGHELYESANKLATKCRCGACFTCLREAGCLTY